MSTGLKTLLWLIRGLQLCCAVIVLALYSYFLVTLSDHKLDISQNMKAVEGIAGAAVLYTIIGLLVTCCLAGLPLTSFFAMLLDLAFACAFIFVAVANKNGSGSCTGDVTTPYTSGTGTGSTGTTPAHRRSISSLPSDHNACKMETACLAVSILAIFFFIFSIAAELALARGRYRSRRFPRGDPDQYYGPDESGRKPGFFARLFGARHTPMNINPANMLPEHTHPDQLQRNDTINNRTSHNTDTTAVGMESPYHKIETGYGSAYHSPDSLNHHHNQQSSSPVVSSPYQGEDVGMASSPYHNTPTRPYDSDLGTPTRPYDSDLGMPTRPYNSDLGAASRPYNHDAARPYHSDLGVTTSMPPYRSTTASPPVISPLSQSRHSPIGETYHQNTPTPLPYPRSPTSAYQQPYIPTSHTAPNLPTAAAPQPPHNYHYTDGVYDRQ